MEKTAQAAVVPGAVPLREGALLGGAQSLGTGVHVRSSERFYRLSSCAQMAPHGSPWLPTIIRTSPVGGGRDARAIGGTFVCSARGIVHAASIGNRACAQAGVRARRSGWRLECLA